MYSFWHLNPNKLSPPDSLLNLAGGIVKKEKEKINRGTFQHHDIKIFWGRKQTFFLICIWNS